MRGEEAEQRPESLAAGGERLACDLLREPRLGGDRARELRLHLRHVGGDARRRVDLCERHSATPECSATIEPASRRNRVSPNPQSRINPASASAAGNRFTEAGR